MEENITLISWNVNGIRAIYRRDFLLWLYTTTPTLLALQETRAAPDQLPPELRDPAGYHSYWVTAARKGYSGVGLLSKSEPANIRVGLGIPEYDIEGRTLIAEYRHFTLVSAYFPSGAHDPARIDFKLAYSDALLQTCQQIRAGGKPVLICGDVNIAHRPIDLTYPKANEKNSGFTPRERAWLDKLFSLGYVDTFRHFYPDTPSCYTWWTNRLNARARNIGWRIDYVICSVELVPALRDAFILKDVTGSDHCPVGVTLAF